MSTSGSSVHKTIKSKIGEVESSVSGLASQIYEKERSLAGLTSEREKYYGLLASHYLPESDASALAVSLRELREDVEKIFYEKKERRKALERAMEENRRGNQELERRIDELTAQIDQKAVVRDRIVELIAGDLKKDPIYVDFDEEAKKAEARLQQNRQRVAEVEEEARTKLPAFTGNKLFRYLLQTGYGTENYRPGRLRRRLDTWVARKVSFTENKKCYDFLTSMPEMMGAEVERRQNELDKIVADMEKIESQIETQRGLPETVDSANRLISQRQEFISQDAEQDKRYAIYARERAEIDSTKDPYHVKAVQNIKQYLKGESITQLKTIARKTPGTEDDRTVDIIDQIDRKVRELKDETITIRRERDLLEEKLSDIRSVEKRFRQRDYEGRYSTFSGGFDINDLLVGYMLGKFSVNDINSKMDNSQHTQRSSYHSSGSYSSRGSSSSSSSSSSGFGGFSSFSSGGGFGGGGFSSGSGF